MTVREVLNLAAGRAGRTADNILGAEVLLAHSLKLEKEDLFMEPYREAGETAESKFFALFERFYAGEPLAYLIGKKEFYGLDFYVDPNVLIPRPETEMLVDEVLKLASVRDEKVKILDIGTGSGCIAVALAKKLERAVITATDISGTALEIAKKNADTHGVLPRIDFLRTDLMEDAGGPFDIIVANLPYIGEKKFNFISREAEKYEPHVALFGGDDGLGLYEKLFRQLSSRPWKPQFLLGEFGFLQGDAMRDMLGRYFGAGNCSIIKDYALIERVFVVGFSAKT